jgi:hypothetical protein
VHNARLITIFDVFPLAEKPEISLPKEIEGGTGFAHRALYQFQSWGHCQTKQNLCRQRNKGANSLPLHEPTESRFLSF